jgi:hypothetical protein
MFGGKELNPALAAAAPAVFIATDGKDWFTTCFWRFKGREFLTAAAASSPEDESVHTSRLVPSPPLVLHSSGESSDAEVLLRSESGSFGSGRGLAW